MRLKKLAAAFLAALMLGGCASEQSSTAESSSQPTETTAAAATTTTAAATTAAGTTSAASEAETESSTAEKPASEITPLMWEVTSDKGGKLVLMGSMHALTEDCYPLPETITSALDSADALAVECDVTNTATSLAAQMSELQEMYYSDGSTIADHLSPEVLAGVQGFAEACGFSLALYRTAKPWVYTVLMESAVMSQTDLDLSLSIDMALTKLAKEKGKEIIELESAEFQTGIISSLSDETCEVLLSSYTADTKEQMVQQMNDMFTAWTKGDYDYFANANDVSSIEGELKTLTEEEAEHVRSVWLDYNEQMLFSRNRSMTAKAEQLLEEGRNVFLVVGTAHFCGDKGIVELLKADGYEVRQIQP